MARKRLSKSSLLWFIRSRSYVTLADIRRRFGVDLSESEDVSGMRGPQGLAFVGLPTHQARIVQELWCEGKIGLEFAHDIMAPSVSGVYGIFSRGVPFAQPVGDAIARIADPDSESEDIVEAASA